jgi:dihydroorotase
MTDGQAAFDVVIIGGEVIDPGGGTEGRADIGIRGGKIAAVEPDLRGANSKRTVDASGRLVTPGLVDLHTHIYWGVTYWGIEADPVAARTGVTTWLDVGSAGAYSFPGFREYIAKPSKCRVFALLNLSSIGLIAPTWELANPDYWDLKVAKQIIDANRDIILGIKARIDKNTTRGVGIAAMAKARELADLVHLPLMTHIGSGPPTIDEVADYLRPGDILTHCFTGGDMRILNDDGTVNPRILDLKKRGLILDIGHGTGSFDYEVAEAMLAQGIPPDVISSDIHQLSVQGPMFDLPTTLSKFLNLGMSLRDVIRAATVTPAQAMGRTDLGTLAVGKPADLALFRQEEGEFTFHDVAMHPREGHVRLVNTATFVDGEELPRQPEREKAVWADLPEVQQQGLDAVEAAGRR